MRSWRQRTFFRVCQKQHSLAYTNEFSGILPIHFSKKWSSITYGTIIEFLLTPFQVFSKIPVVQSSKYGSCKSFPELWYSISELREKVVIGVSTKKLASLDVVPVKTATTFFPARLQSEPPSDTADRKTIFLNQWACFIEEQINLFVFDVSQKYIQVMSNVISCTIRDFSRYN